ncbi:heparinase II/III family protein [Actinomadura sp. ATCC 31491]|uniref:Heparinase II/III family protein n=1 Tax=Actinomadura luzonensis TaxID=2805427 RepID=A0ABT0FLA5_9ACTN|nr:heparinase II/III family protein [Actinomadura luzonensis]MCK2212746.1 heparinase II/III family protein [Actinomadura luzonensis]
MRRLAIPLALVLALGGGLTTPARADKVTRTAACQGDWLPGTPTADDVMRGEISLVGLPAVKLGEKIDWGASPYRNRSWEFVFQSLRWMGALVVEYENTGEQRYLDRATQIAKDWVTHNKYGASGTKSYVWQDHPVSLRTQPLLCLSEHVKDSWLKDSLAVHAKLLSNPALYKKGHNHGIDQDIALMGIGCRYGRKDWADLAARRLTGTVKLDVDAQGALMEQAPRYAVYVYGRLQVAMTNMKSCDRRVPGEIAARAEALKDFIAHATMPNGFMTPIGDGSAETEPKMETGTPKQKVKVYRAGYVFGRTAWGKPDSAYYSIRFGPGMKFHGHEDHLGVTYYAQGHDVLVDAGFHSYEKSAYRYWTLSPEAHNVPTVAGARFRPRTASKLVKSSLGADRQAFRLTDRAYGVSRTRSVLVNHGEQDLMAVLDTASGGRKVQNVWRFAPSLKPVSTGGGRVVLGDGKFRVTLVQFTPSCERVGGQKVERGGRLGWVSPVYLSKEAATVVVSPAAKALLTVIVPGGDEAKVSCSGGKVTVEGASFATGLL